MSSDLLASVAGAVLSLVFEYIPGLAPKYAALTPEWKRLVMAGALLLVSAAVFGLSCVNYDFGWKVACDQGGAVGLLKVFILALIANQSTHLIAQK